MNFNSEVVTEIIVVIITMVMIMMKRNMNMKSMIECVRISKKKLRLCLMRIYTTDRVNHDGVFL